MIGWGTDTVNTDELKRRVTEMEQHIPFDGIIITVYPDEYRKPGVPFTQAGGYARWFGGKKHSRDDFKTAVADLKATKFKRFTDNFLYLQTLLINANLSHSM